MWHNAVWFEPLQKSLKQAGYSSIAIDLLPGERFLVGFTQREIVADLERTIGELLAHENDNTELVIVGHSQGGLVAQSCLLNSPYLKSRTRGVVLMGTFPLGGTFAEVSIIQKRAIPQPTSFYNHIGILGILFFGRVLSKKYMQHIFLRPTTDLNSTEMKRYADMILNAPADDMITMSHFPDSRVKMISTIPALILGAESDIIYPPSLVKEGFAKRFPSASHVVVRSQAHCFMDPCFVQDSEGEFHKYADTWFDHPFELLQWLKKSI